MMGTKEDTHCDEHGVLYVRDESLSSTPEINTILYVNLNLSKILEEKKYQLYGPTNIYIFLSRSQFLISSKRYIKCI